MATDAKKRAQVHKLEAERLEKGFKEGWLYYRCREKKLGSTLKKMVANGDIVRSNSPKAKSNKQPKKQTPSDKQDELQFFQLVKKELAPGQPIQFPNLEILPDRVHHQNIRNLIAKKDWQKLRRACFWSANYQCQSCGYKRKNDQEPNFDCHEVWRYDDNTRKQVLEELQCLCRHCHQIKHMNFLGNSIEKISRTVPFKKFCELSGYTEDEAKEYIERQIELADHRDRPQQDKIDWELDVSIILRVGITPTPQVMAQGVDIPAMRAKREKYRKKAKEADLNNIQLKHKPVSVSTKDSSDQNFETIPLIQLALLLGAVALLIRIIF